MIEKLNRLFQNYKIANHCKFLILLKKFSKYEYRLRNRTIFKTIDHSLLQRKINVSFSNFKNTFIPSENEVNLIENEFPPEKQNRNSDPAEFLISKTTNIEICQNINYQSQNGCTK